MTGAPLGLAGPSFCPPRSAPGTQHLSWCQITPAMCLDVLARHLPPVCPLLSHPCVYLTVVWKQTLHHHLWPTDLASRSGASGWGDLRNVQRESKLNMIFSFPYSSPLPEMRLLSRKIHIPPHGFPSSLVNCLPAFPASPPHSRPGQPSLLTVPPAPWARSGRHAMPFFICDATKFDQTLLCFLGPQVSEEKKKKGGLVCPFAWLLDPDLQGWELSGERGRWESEGQPPSLVRVGLTGNLGGPEGWREGEARWPEGTAEKASPG